MDKRSKIQELLKGYLYEKLKRSTLIFFTSKSGIKVVCKPFVQKYEDITLLCSEVFDFKFRDGFIVEDLKTVRFIITSFVEVSDVYVF